MSEKASQIPLSAVAFSRPIMMLSEMRKTDKFGDIIVPEQFVHASQASDISHVLGFMQATVNDDQ
jgi:hypothetical protein